MTGRYFAKRLLSACNYCLTKTESLKVCAVVVHYVQKISRNMKEEDTAYVTAKP